METIKELLDKLKEIDEETYDDILNLELIGWHKPRNMALDHLQGCIQRACKQNDWFYGQFSMSHQGPYSADITDANNVDNHWFGTGNSPAEAILTAYVTAVTGGT